MKKRKIVQIATLLLFVVLLILGKVQIWMVIFGGSLLLSTYFGRFYCGYICPINTGMELIDDRANKSKRKRKKTPEVFKSPLIRYGVLALFLGTMVIVFKTGKKLPVLPVLFASGILLTVFYKPDFWHRYLCPYGTLLSAFSSFNKRTYRVYNEDCTKCGRCVRVCPADAFAWEDKKDYPLIIKNECIQCGKCVETCPEDTIKKQEKNKARF